MGPKLRRAPLSGAIPRPRARETRKEVDCGTCIVGHTSGSPCPFVPTARPAGTVLCTQGDHQGTLFLLRAGRVVLTALSPQGVEAFVSVRGPGDILNLETLRGKRSACEIRALTTITFCSLGREALMRWVGFERSPARSLLELAAADADRLREEAAWRQGGCVERTARFVLKNGSLLTRSEPGGLRKQVAARVLGMRPETLSRCLRKLADLGLVSVRNGVRVLNPAGLANLTGDEAR